MLGKKPYLPSSLVAIVFLTFWVSASIICTWRLGIGCLVLLSKARLSGEVIILPSDNISIAETVNKFSYNADFIMMGMPGNVNSNGLQRIFKINEKFFDKEIHKYDKMPAMLFVKSASLMNLIEDYNK